MKPWDESPAFFGALGLALAFYGFPSLAKTGLVPLAALLPALFAGISFFRVLACLPPALRASAPRPRRALGLRFSPRFIAFASGLCLGLAAARVLPPPPHFGLGENHRITALSGVLENDPRQLNGGRGMASLAMRTVSAEGGIRASASGTAPVFFPAELVPALMEAAFGKNLGRGRGASGLGRACRGPAPGSKGRS